MKGDAREEMDTASNTRKETNYNLAISTAQTTLVLCADIEMVCLLIRESGTKIDITITRESLDE